MANSHCHMQMFTRTPNVCVILSTGGPAWLPGGGCLLGGMHGCGLCVVVGACMVARLYPWLVGGVCGWGACMVAGGGLSGCMNATPSLDMAM